MNACVWLRVVMETASACEGVCLREIALPPTIGVPGGGRGILSISGAASGTMWAGGGFATLLIKSCGDMSRRSKGKWIANYFDNWLIVRVNFPSKKKNAGFHLLKREDSLFFLFLSFMVVDEESLGFGLLVARQRGFEDLNEGSGKLWWAFFPILWQFIE